MDLLRSLTNTIVNMVDVYISSKRLINRFAKNQSNKYIEDQVGKFSEVKDRLRLFYMEMSGASGELNFKEQHLEEIEYVLSVFKKFFSRAFNKRAQFE